MKTTIDISDALSEQARAQAKDRGLTLQAMVESGLRLVMAQPKAVVEPFQLRDFSFGASRTGGEPNALPDPTTWRDIANPGWTLQDGHLMRVKHPDSPQ